MSRRRVIFFAIFGLYHLLVLLFTSYIDIQKQDLGVLTRMYGFIYLFKYGAFLGLLLLAVDFIWSLIAQRATRQEMEVLKGEVMKLKAKVYDLQKGTQPLINKDSGSSTQPGP